MNNVLANVTLTGTRGFALEPPENQQTGHLCLIRRTQASVCKDPNKGFIYF